MRHLLFLFFFLYCLSNYAQLTVQQNVAIQDLVQTLVGPGIEVSNITFNGQVVNNSVRASSFTDAGGGNNAGFGIEEGIVLSTIDGRLVSRSGTNIPVTEDYGFNAPLNPYPQGREPDLENLAGGELHDASILEFDFIPKGNEVEVKFVFASDEYNVFVCGEYNDVFGFFISGPGINGPYSNNAENIAVVPGTNVAVSVNTINNGQAPLGNGCIREYTQYFVYNVIPGGSISDMLFRGFTVPMLAKSKVQCGEKYHIKLAIADVSDSWMNTAIFLEKGSFKSEEEDIVASIVSGNEDGAIEACEDITVKLERVDKTKDLTVVLEVVGGTATEGVDYSAIPKQILIPEGELSQTFTIDVLGDNILENIEDVQIRAYIELVGCKTIVIQDTFEFKIKDIQPLNLEDKETCKGGSVQLNANGGDKYKWSPTAGLNNPNIPDPIATPNETTTYTVTVSNLDGSCERTGEVTVTISNINADAGSDVSICRGGAVQLNGKGGGTYSWNPTIGLDNPNIQNPTSTTEETITYTLTVTDLSGKCEAKDEVTVRVEELVADAGPDLSICRGGSVQLTGKGGETFLWSPETGLDDPEIANPVSSTTETLTYTLTVKDISGTCTATDEVTVTVAEMVVNAGEDVTICLGDTTTLTAIGGGSTYTWSPVDFLATPDEASTLAYPTRSTTYTVKVEDITGKCSATDDVVVNVEELEPDFEVMPVCLDSLSKFNNLTPVGNFQNIKWNWDFGDKNVSDQKNPEHLYSQSGIYTVKLGVVAGSCNGLVEKEVIVHAKPTANFEVTPKVLSTENPTVKCVDLSTLGSTGIWDLGDGTKKAYISGETINHTYPILDEGKNYLIQLFVVSENGCKDSTAVEIEIKSNWNIYFPNTFTPNNDGINDFFKPNSFGITSFQMSVYNRWGEVIFKTTDLEKGWDGKIKLHDVNQGVYVWSAIVENNEGKTKRFIGHVNLLK